MRGGHHFRKLSACRTADALRFNAALPRAVREALVAWEHSACYELPGFKDFIAGSGGGGGGFSKTYALGAEHAFLRDHVVDGRILMPVRSAVQRLLLHCCYSVLASDEHRPPRTYARPGRRWRPGRRFQCRSWPWSSKT